MVEERGLESAIARPLKLNLSLRVHFTWLNCPWYLHGMILMHQSGWTKHNTGALHYGGGWLGSWIMHNYRIAEERPLVLY